MLSYFIKYSNLGKGIWATLISRIISALGYMMLMPYLSVILIKYHGIPVEEVALITSIYIFSTTGLMVPATFFISKFGYKSSMIIGRIFGGVICILFLYIKYTSLLVFISLLMGFGTSLYNLACKSYISIEAKDDPQKKLNIFTLYNMSLNIGGSVGPLIASFFIDGMYFKYLLFIVAFLNIISVIVVDRLTTDVEKTENVNSIVSTLRGYKNVLLNRDIYLLMGITILAQILFTQFFSVLPLYLSKTNNNMVSYSILLIINTVMGVFAQVPLSQFGNKFIKNRNFVGLGIGTAFLAIGIALISQSWNYYVLLLSAVLFTIGELIFTPFEDKSVSDIAYDINNTSMYFSVFSLGWAIGKGIGSFIGITLVGYFGGAIFWVIISGFGWLATLICFIKSNILKKREIYYSA